MSIIRKIQFINRLSKGRPRGWKSLVWNTGMARLHRDWPLMTPALVSLEPTNFCNARCPVCETGKGEMTRPQGFLDFHHYKKLIDEIARKTNTVMFYFMGEPFMHKQAYDMIRYARDRGMFVETCTNGDLVDAKGVIYSDINKISFQIGGMDQETHQVYRVRSNLDKIRNNLAELVRERQKNGQSNVQIDLGFIVMKHNEHQVKPFLEWAEKIGVDSANIIDPCARNMEEAGRYLTTDRQYWFYDEQAYARGRLRPKVVPHNECLWLWNTVTINWNGDAVPCCRDPLGHHLLGNVFEDGLQRVWNGRQARAFRREILTNQGRVDICHLCSGYGLPVLQQQRPTKFTVARHTVNYASGDRIVEGERTARG